jgi:predicted RNA-binding protein with PUA-like domain
MLDPNPIFSDLVLSASRHSRPHRVALAMTQLPRVHRCSPSIPPVKPPGMAKHYWLVKQEPEAYSWSDFAKDGRASWTGVRNFQARNNLRAMTKGDPVLFYHSGEGKEVVGLARVERAHYADPTADEGDWAAVDLAPVKPLSQPVTLQTIKADATLKEMPLVRNSRLSVSPVTEEQFKLILKLAGTKL